MPQFGWQPDVDQVSLTSRVVAESSKSQLELPRLSVERHAPTATPQPVRVGNPPSYWVPARPGDLPPTIIRRPRTTASQQVARKFGHPVAVAMTVAAVSTASFWSSGYTAGIQTDPDETLRDKYQRTASLADHLDATTSDSGTVAAVTTESVSVAPEAAPAARGGVITYTVQPGDMVREIAKAHGLSTWTLIAANNLQNPDLIHPGDVLIIPTNDGMAHEVQQGETLRDIAGRYGVTVEAIINYEPNGITNADVIFPGQVFFIPSATPPVAPQPVAESSSSETVAQSEAEPQVEAEPEPQAEPEPEPVGLEHEVQAGDTLGKIADRYSVSVDSIIEFAANGISNRDMISVGQILFVPNGIMPAEPEPVVAEAEPVVEAQAEAEAEPVVESASAEATPEPSPTQEPVAASGVANGYFIWPVEGVITQRFGLTSFAQSSGWYGSSGHTGLDIANRTNTPIYAADGGTVVVSGWSGGYGFAVAIDHGNGYVTWYAHMANQPPVSVGQRVSQGEYIGPVGSTGYSTGPHLHFEIRKNGQYQDPLQYLR
jgi:murein DD-endopeptidase MepM/ murein hydrolase activator NlpD